MNRTKTTQKPEMPEDSFWVKAWNNTDCWSPEALLEGVCIICGREITNPATAHKVSVDEHDNLTQPGKFTFDGYLIGPECWKKFPEFHPYEQ